MTLHPRDDMDLDDQEQLFFQHLGPLSRPRRDPNQADSSNPPSSGAAKRPRVEGPERSKGKGGKGKGKAKGPSGKNVGLQQWLRRGPSSLNAVDNRAPRTSGLAGGESGPSHADGPSTGADTFCSQTRPDAVPVCPERRARHDSHLVPGSREMAGCQGGDAGEAGVLLKTRDVQAIDAHSTGTAQRNIGEPTGHGSSQVHELGRSGGLLADSQMEWGQAEPGDRHQCAAHIDRESFDPDRAGQKGHKRDLAHPVQIHPTADRGCADRVGDLPDLCVPSSGGSSHLELFDIVDRTSCIPHDRMQTATRPTAIRCLSSQPLGVNTGAIPSLRMLLQVSLHNDTNLCYLNSTALAAAWTILQAQLHGHPTRLVPALSLLCHRAKSPSNRPVRLPQHLPWQLLLQGWRNVHQQHDAPELVMHLLPRLQASNFEGRWEARVQTVHELRITDAGRLHAPLVMFPHPGDTLYLQRVIDQWHLQAAVHALVSPPSILCLQLQRFTGERGDLLRNVRPLQDCHHKVHVPIFLSDTATQVRPAVYEVTAIQLHFGRSPETGHYRTVLRGQKEFGHPNQWITDDNCPAVSATTTHPEAAYLLWLRQVDA